MEEMYKRSGDAKKVAKQKRANKMMAKAVEEIAEMDRDELELGLA
jgi:hypothetical protein